LSIKYKVLIIVGAVVGLYVALYLALLRFLVLESFHRLEVSEAEEDMKRCVKTLNRELFYLERTCDDYAAWDDTYLYIQGLNKQFEPVNLLPETYIDNNLAVIIICNKLGEVKYSGAYIIPEMTPLEVPGLTDRTSLENSPIFDDLTIAKSSSDIYFSDHGPLLVTAMPILRSDNTGPPMGCFVMGRLLNETLLNAMSRQIEVDFEIWPLLEGKYPSEYAKSVVTRFSTQQGFIIDVQPKTLNVFSVFSIGVSGNSLLIKSTFNRDISAKGRQIVLNASLSVVLSGLLIGLAVIIFLRRTLLEPLMAVANSAGYSAHLEHHFGSSALRRKDEIGILEASVKAYQESLRKLATDLSLAEEKQRRIIAARLHDSVGHNLAALQMKLEDLQELEDSPENRDKIGLLRELVKCSIDDVRSLIFEISPPLLYELGLGAAVGWQMDQLRERHGIGGVLNDASLKASIPPDVSVVLYQALKELLFNVAKHSKAKQVKVAMGSSSNNVWATIEDDGIGFDPSKIGPHPQGGFGLFSVRERLASLGGRMVVESLPEKGTKIRIELPLDPSGD